MANTYTLRIGTPEDFDLLDYTIIADSGAFVSAGTAAALGASPAIAASPGSYLATGSEVTLISSGSEHPNEPATLGQLTDNDMSVVPGEEWSGSSTSKLFATTDATAPKSPSGVIRHFFPSGTVSDSSTLQGHAHALTGVSYRYIYAHFWIKMSDPFQGHSSAVNKLLWVRNLSADNNDVWVLRGSGSSSTYNIVFNKQGFSSEDPEQSRRYDWDDADNEVSNGSASISVGQWAEIEMLHVGSTTSSAPHDGELHLWIDGTKKFQFTSEWLMDSGVNGKWTEFFFQYFWGGLNDTLNQDQWWDIDHVYVSGKN